MFVGGAEGEEGGRGIELGVLDAEGCVSNGRVGVEGVERESKTVGRIACFKVFCNFFAPTLPTP